MRGTTFSSGIEVAGRKAPGFDRILTPDALAFVAMLHRRFETRRRELLSARTARQARLDAGELPDFLPRTHSVREADWTVAPAPADLLDRRVEITGPPTRKMIVNALNSGAKVFMADFEDANSPTWENNVGGQIHLADAVRREIDFTAPNGREYALDARTATLMVRPRGWHLEERALRVDGEPVSASLFDFGLFFFHNAHELVARGSGPYFYLPKLENHLEARLWNDVFVAAQEELGVPNGTIRATVLIETILAAFEMDEILWELRDHSAGLNCGRWDYIFSVIKKLRNHARFLLPDRAQVTMTAPFMRAYSLLLIRTCHRRRAHAMGGMAAQIPIKGDAAANEAAFAKVRADKEREASDGHDGTWVAHPGLVATAREIFDRVMPGANQLERLREDVDVGAAELLEMPTGGTITREGLELNIAVGLRYLEAWLRGFGCVPLNHLMEDAATAEISRAQLWQWIRHDDGRLTDGTEVSADLVRKGIRSELVRIAEGLGAEGLAASRFDDAAELLQSITTTPAFAEFLTLPACERL